MAPTTLIRPSRRSGAASRRHLSLVASAPIRVLIAEEHALVRAGLRALLDTEPAISVAGEATDLHQAVLLARRMQPDVVVFHARHGSLDAREASERFAMDPELGNVGLLVLSTPDDDDDYVLGAPRAGVTGLPFNETRPEDLLGAVQVLARRDLLPAPPRWHRALTVVASSEADKEN
jgi:DNA-binding NarL/FixJ family response regulator